MADLSKVLMALALGSTVLHPEGHFLAGEDARLKEPVSIDYFDRTEKWRTSNRRADTKITAGGFEYQDSIAKALKQGDWESGRAMEVANSIYKLLYPYTVAHITSGRTHDKTGDVGALERLSGNPYTQEMLIASALAGFVPKNPKRDWSLDFVTPGGIPSLMFTMETDFLGGK